MQLSSPSALAAASLLLDSLRQAIQPPPERPWKPPSTPTFVTIGAIAAASSFIFALVDKNKGITRRRKKAA